jgi:hypothetical protein
MNEINQINNFNLINTNIDLNIDNKSLNDYKFNYLVDISSYF